MKPSLAFLAAALLAFLVTPGGAAQARPPAPFPLDLSLRGEARRFAMADTGWSGIYGSGMCITGADVTGNLAGKVVEFIPSAAINLCTRPSDAGCSSTPSDRNYGEPVASGASHIITLKDDTTVVCQSGASNTAIFILE